MTTLFRTYGNPLIDDLPKWHYTEGTYWLTVPKWMSQQKENLADKLSCWFFLYIFYYGFHHYHLIKCIIQFFFCFCFFYVLHFTVFEYFILVWTTIESCMFICTICIIFLLQFWKQNKVWLIKKGEVRVTLKTAWLLVQRMVQEAK